MKKEPKREELLDAMARVVDSTARTMALAHISQGLQKIKEGVDLLSAAAGIIAKSPEDLQEERKDSN